MERKKLVKEIIRDLEEMYSYLYDYNERGQSHLRHILTKKSSKRKRQLGSIEPVADGDVKAVRKLLPYG